MGICRKVITDIMSALWKVSSMLALNRSFLNMEYTLINVLKALASIISMSKIKPRYVTWEVVSFTPRSLYPRGNSLRYPLDRPGGHQSRDDCSGEEKNLLLLQGIEP
jgi:hypothetical protein